MNPGTLIWVRNSNFDVTSYDSNIWLPGVVLSKDAGDLTVKFTSGKESLTQKITKNNVKSEIRLRNAFGSAVARFDNLSDLPFLNEPEIIQFLSARYQQNRTYTYFGPILISVNPVLRTNELRDDRNLERFAQENKMKQLGSASSDEHLTGPLTTTSGANAHVWDIANIVYTQIKRTLPSETNTSATNLLSTSSDSAGSGVLPVDLHHSILISGESGSGKSEAFKCILKYLVHESQTNDDQEEKQKKANSKSLITRKMTRSFSFYNNIQTSIVDKILLADNILEAFGNAKTKRNDNSSRYGKYVEVGFNHRGVLIGGSIRSYLLETSRITSQALGERNFHVFYQLLSGASEGEQRRFNFGLLQDYNYLNQGKTPTAGQMDDRSDYIVLKEHLSDLGVDDELVEDVIQTLAGIIHLGQVSFEGVVDEHLESCRIIDMRPLKKAAELCGIVPAELEQLLLVKANLLIRGESIARQMTVSQAIASRDAIAKAIYNRVFDIMVNEVNRKIVPAETSGMVLATVGILDIYGFECTNEQNYFDDLCINYANETLQCHFHRGIKQLAKDEYELQFHHHKLMKIETRSDLIVENNASDCLELINKYIFAILDVQCKIPNMTDRKLASIYYSSCANKPAFVASSIDRGLGQFGVVHYAGVVVYDTKGFIEKNLDEMSDAAEKLINSSSIEILRDSSHKEAASSRPTTPRGRALAPQVSTFVSRTSTAHHFKDQLTELMNLIDLTKPQYICCVKPMEVNNPKEIKKHSTGFKKLFNQKKPFDEKRIVEQLTSGGVFEAVRVVRGQHPIRLRLLDFYERYRCLAANVGLISPISSPGQPQMRHSIPMMQRGGNYSVKYIQQQCLRLAEILAVQQISHRVGPIGPDVLRDITPQIGTTTVYLSDDDFLCLEALRQKVMAPAGRIILRFFKSCERRRRNKQLLLQVVKMQKMIRCFTAMSRFRRCYRCIVSIQRIYGNRCVARRVWNDFQSVIRKYILIQSTYRRHLCRTYYLYVKELKREFLEKSRKLQEEFERSHVDLIEAKKLRMQRRALYTPEYYRTDQQVVAASRKQNTYSNVIFTSKLSTFKESDNQLCVWLGKLIAVATVKDLPSGEPSGSEKLEPPKPPAATPPVTATQQQQPTAINKVPFSNLKINPAAPTNGPEIPPSPAIRVEVLTNKNGNEVKEAAPVKVLVPFNVDECKALMDFWRQQLPRQSVFRGKAKKLISAIDFGGKLLVYESWKPPSLKAKLINFGTHAAPAVPYIPVTNREHPMFARIVALLTDIEHGLMLVAQERKRGVSADPPDASGHHRPSSNAPRIFFNEAVNRSVDLMVDLLNKLQMYYTYCIDTVIKEFGANSSYKESFRTVELYYRALAMKIKAKEQMIENEAYLIELRNSVPQHADRTSGSNNSSTSSAGFAAAAAGGGSKEPPAPAVAPPVHKLHTPTPPTPPAAVAAAAPVAPKDTRPPVPKALRLTVTPVSKEGISQLKKNEMLHLRTPVTPGVDFIMNSLFHLMASERNPLHSIRLLRTTGGMITKSKAVVNRVATDFFEISHYDQPIVMQNFASLLQTRGPQGIELLDPASVSSLILSNIIAGVTVAKPEYFNVSLSGSGASLKAAFHRVTHDSQGLEGLFNFREPSTSERALNILYCLPQMDEPVDRAIRTYLLSNLSTVAEEIVSNWCNYAFMQNMHFESLPRSGYTENELALLNLPLLLPRGTAVALYRRLQVLCDLLDSQEVITHHDVLSAFYPNLAAFYLKLRCPPMTPHTRAANQHDEVDNTDLVHYYDVYKKTLTSEPGTLFTPDGVPRLKLPTPMEFVEFHRRRLNMPMPIAKPSRLQDNNNSSNGSKPKAPREMRTVKSVSFDYDLMFGGTDSIYVQRMNQEHANDKAFHSMSQYSGLDDLGIDLEVEDDGLDFNDDEAYDEDQEEENGIREMDMGDGGESDDDMVLSPASPKRMKSFGFDQIYGERDDFTGDKSGDGGGYRRIDSSVLLSKNTSGFSGSSASRVGGNASSPRMTAPNSARSMYTVKSCASFRFDQIYGDYRDDDTQNWVGFGKIEKFEEPPEQFKEFVRSSKLKSEEQRKNTEAAASAGATAGVTTEAEMVNYNYTVSNTAEDLSNSSTIAEIATEFVKKIDFKTLANRDNHICHKLLTTLSFLPVLWLRNINESQLKDMFGKAILDRIQRSAEVRGDHDDNTMMMAETSLQVHTVNVIVENKAMFKALDTALIIQDMEQVLQLRVNFLLGETTTSTNSGNNTVGAASQISAPDPANFNGATTITAGGLSTSSGSGKYDASHPAPNGTEEITSITLENIDSVQDELMSEAEQEAFTERLRLALRSYAKHVKITPLHTEEDVALDIKAIMKVAKVVRSRQKVAEFNIKYLNIFAEVLLESHRLAPIALELVPLGMFNRIPKLLHSLVTAVKVEKYVDVIQAMVKHNPELLPMRNRSDNLRCCDHLKKLSNDLPFKYRVLTFCINQSIVFNNAYITEKATGYYDGYGASIYNLKAVQNDKVYRPILSSYSGEEELIVLAVSYGFPATEEELFYKAYNFHKTDPETGENLMYRVVGMMTGAIESSFPLDFHSRTCDLLMEILRERDIGVTLPKLDVVTLIWDFKTIDGRDIAGLVRDVSQQTDRHPVLQALLDELMNQWKGFLFLEE